MKTIAIIPARYASQRLPGKPLADLLGKPMLQRVWEAAVAADVVDEVHIATDHPSIFDAAKSWGASVWMTDPELPNGTARVAACYQKAGLNADVVVNLQGDEPFLIRDHFIDLLKGMDQQNVEITTLAYPESDKITIQNPNRVKVVTDLKGRALYFSRSVIPYTNDSTKTESAWIHMGFYAFKTETLFKIIQLSNGKWESLEQLEQLRWIEHGIHIQVNTSKTSHISIDTSEDLAKAIAHLSEQLNNPPDVRD